MKILFLLALGNVFASPPLPSVQAQTRKPIEPRLLGSWKATAALSRGDSVQFTVVFQPNGRGYWGSEKRSPFAYSFPKPNLLKLSGAGKPQLYSIEFITANTFHVLSYPPVKADVEEIALVETVIFRRQQVPVLPR